MYQITKSIGHSVLMSVLIITIFSCSKELVTEPPQPNSSGLTAKFTASVTNGTAPVVIQFDASESNDSDGKIVSYEWNFDDGSPTQIGVKVQNTFRQKGDYRVVLLITDNEGHSETATKTVHVTEPPDPTLFPFYLGSRWSYDIKMQRQVVPDPPESDLGKIVVTVTSYDGATLTATLTITGTLNYPNTSGTLPETIQIRETANGLERYVPSNGQWKIILKKNSSSWYDGRFLFAGFVDTRTSLTPVYSQITPAGTYDGLLTKAAENNFDEKYAIERFENISEEIYNPDVGLIYSRRYNYFNDGEIFTPGPYIFSQVLTLTGFTIADPNEPIDPLSDEFSFSPGSTSGEASVVYDRNIPINIHFPDHMNTTSVEQALSVFSDWEQQELSGSFTWLGDKYVKWVPNFPYPDGYITVTIGTSAETATRNPYFADNFVFYFFVDPNAGG